MSVSKFKDQQFPLYVRMQRSKRLSLDAIRNLHKHSSIIVAIIDSTDAD